MLCNFAFETQQLTPNNSLQRTFENVTPFVCAKTAPLLQAAELRR